MSLRIYTNRNTIIYFALSAPALVLQAFFIFTVLKLPTLQLPGLFQYASLAVQYAPWFVLAGSVFAVITFRSSLLLMLLILSYFLSSVISGSASIIEAGYILGPGDIAAAVVAASFCSLIGFGFSRAARIQKKKPIISVNGPMYYQAISVFLEIFFPALIAVALVLVTIHVIGALQVETQFFPSPLSSIFSSFLLSPIVTIIVAALTLTFVKDVVEPWILYYTINKEDAIKIMQKEATEMQVQRGFTGKIASGGVVFSVIVIIILMGIVVYFFGTQSILANLSPVFLMGKPSSEPNFLVRIDNYYVQFENLLNEIIRLLWG